MRVLRPLRLLVPLVAVGGALVVFLTFGFLAYQVGSGGGSGGLTGPGRLRCGVALDEPLAGRSDRGDA